jgi:hypothetical protein
VHGVAIACLALLTLVLFGPLLVAEPDRIVSSRLGDTAKNLYQARLFGFGELRNGNLPLWNPHLFSGTPFVGSFQTSMLYPPNLLYLALPIAAAIDLDFALHLLLIGSGMFAWGRSRGLSALASLYAAATLMLCAPVFLRVLAGQLTVLGVVAWAPLLFLAIDGILDRGAMPWTLLGILTATLMILAGHPPTVLMTALLAALYCLLRLPGAGRRRRAWIPLAAVAIAPCLLAAAQLWTGLEAGAQSTRAGGLDWDFATSFSFPPESLLTLLAADLFGGVSQYWGRWFYWDDSAFLGLTSVGLAVYGAASGERPLRWLAIAMLAASVAFALGRYAPFYALLYHAVPGFDRIRAPSKFMFHAALFTALLAGAGADRLLRDPVRTRRIAVGLAVLSALALTGALWLRAAAEAPPTAGFWQNPLVVMAERSDTLYVPANYPVWARHAAPLLLRTAVVSALLASLWWCVPRSRWVAPCIVVFGIAELLVFARANLESFGVPAARVPEKLESAFRSAGGDRVLFLGAARNFAMEADGYDVWGYDPLILERYARLLAHTQDRSVAEMENVRGRPPDRYHPLLAMLRVARVARGSFNAPLVERAPDPLPHLFLVRRFRVLPDPGAALDAVTAPGFDPRRTVILEEGPRPPPAPGEGAGGVRIVDASTDHLSLDAELETAAILVVTDAYGDGWRARALPGSAQRDYQVLRANSALRAVPLAAGRHRLRLEYLPTGFRIGRWVSLASVGVFLAATAHWWARSGRAGRGPTSPPAPDRSAPPSRDQRAEAGGST